MIREMETIHQYFDHLSENQEVQFSQLNDLYTRWNEKINVISRKDIAELYIRHVLHSLSIARFIRFSGGTHIIDVGTGGGFPGIPLAILFPDCTFHLIDSIAKKTKVVSEVAKELNLQNVSVQQARSEQIKQKYDFVVSRAVTAFPEFVKITRHLVQPQSRNAITNGILYLKGGDFTEEIRPFKKNITVISLTDYFKEPYFETKKLIHLSL